MAWTGEAETSGSWSSEGPEASQAITDDGVAVTDSGTAVVIDSRFVSSAVWNTESLPSGSWDSEAQTVTDGGVAVTDSSAIITVLVL
jgi:hypothetical protein